MIYPIVIESDFPEKWIPLFGPMLEPSPQGPNRTDH